MPARKRRRKGKKPEKIRWQVNRRGKAYGQTDAVSESKARCNVWFTRDRKKASSEKMEEVKAIYHNEITARPVMLQPKRRIKLRPRKQRPLQEQLFAL